MTFKNIVEMHKIEIENDFNQSDYIVSKVKNLESHVIDDIYDSSIMRMCIKYETFTAEAYKFLFEDKNISYNHPWRYTRYIAQHLNINIKKEYKIAHECWDIYNTLKHVNSKTHVRRLNIISKYKLEDSRSVANFVRESLVKLMNKIVK